MYDRVMSLNKLIVLNIASNLSPSNSLVIDCAIGMYTITLSCETFRIIIIIIYIFFDFHYYSYLPSASTTNILYNLNHYLDTAELSPLSDKRGAYGGIAPNEVIARSEFEVHREMFTE